MVQTLNEFSSTRSMGMKTRPPCSGPQCEEILRLVMGGPQNKGWNSLATFLNSQYGHQLYLRRWGWKNSLVWKLWDWTSGYGDEKEEREEQKGS